MLNKLKQNRIELLVLFFLLVIAGVAHGFNMFHFPYYENDEGTYMSQAWSLLTQGKLAPYTYWYDHAPAGWIFIALWVKLTGGFFTFGTSINSGRVLMLLLHLGTATLLFYIAKKLSKSYFAGIIAVLIFSLSPLGIYFQRRVLLDNIMIFWVFLSLTILLKERLKLSHIILSAINFGIAVLTKENAIFFIPAFIYIVYQKSHEHHKSFAIVKWLSVSGIVVSLYFLYALLKGEFFPVGFMGDSSPRVSLLSTLQEQFTRGGSYPFWNKRSDFYVSLMEWIERDSFTIITGAIATILSVFISLKEKSLRVPAFLAVLFWLFLIRGKLVIDFYIIPLIPLLALNIGMLANFFIKIISFNKKFIYYSLGFMVVVTIPIYLLAHPIGQYSRDETTPQIETIKWIKQNLPNDSYIVIDNSIYLDLHERRYPNDRIFPNADWAWKVEKDKEILEGKLNRDWKKIDYITVSHEILKQVKDYKFKFIQKALDNSFLLTEWREKSTAYVDVPKYISTNGDWMAIYKVKNPHKIALESSWRFYKANFIKSYGQVVDPNNNFSTTSEGQSYAMLRAVWLNDKDTFDGVWAWTRDHFQYRLQDKLFSWLWVKDGEDYKLGDSASASDADQDIALALLFAYKQWGDEKYFISAKEVISDIWKQEVVQIGKHYYLISGTEAGKNDGYLVNPSYLSPASYRIFAEVDAKHPWEKLADDSYYLLNKLGIQKNNTTYLPPNWVLLDKDTGEIKSASKHIEDKDVDNYGFDAFRTMWRIALDAVWFKEPQASEYLKKVTPFFVEQLNKEGKLYAIYDLQGNRHSTYESLSTYVGALSVFSQTNTSFAKEVYDKSLQSKFNFDEGYWGNRNNYYDQNWVWFGTALYTNNLPNLWTPQN